MNLDWRELCKGADLEVINTGVRVYFADGRSHRVTVENRDDEYLLRAIVAKESLVESLPDLARITWRKNRSANLVGFRIDKKSQLVAESHVPKFGITPEEFQFYVQHLAVEADRFEYMLSGKDAH